LLGPYTNFKIGGPAKYFVEVKSIDEIQELCYWVRQKARQAKEKIPIFVLGKGSNVLFSDKGFNGLVVRIKNQELRTRRYMKPQEIRDMTADEITPKLKELNDNLFQLKIKLQTKQIENTSQIRVIRKDIARLNTIFKHKQGEKKEETVNGGKK